MQAVQLRFCGSIVRMDDLRRPFMDNSATVHVVLVDSTNDVRTVWRPHWHNCDISPSHCESLASDRTLRSASANLLSVTRCNISFGVQGFRSAAPTIWNSLPSHVRSCETHNIPPSFKISLFSTQFYPLPSDHLSASDSFSTMVLYKSIYLLTYLEQSGVPRASRQSSHSSVSKSDE